MSTSSHTFLDYQIEQSNLYLDSECFDIIKAEMVEAEYRLWQQQEVQQAIAAPVVQLYTDTLPAQPAAVNPLLEELVKHQDAIQATLSELNMLLLNSVYSDESEPPFR